MARGSVDDYLREMVLLLLKETGKFKKLVDQRKVGKDADEAGSYYYDEVVDGVHVHVEVLYDLESFEDGVHSAMVYVGNSRTGVGSGTMTVFDVEDPTPEEIGNLVQLIQNTSADDVGLEEEEEDDDVDSRVNHIKSMAMKHTKFGI